MTDLGKWRRAIEDAVADVITDRYHPEFGTEWREGGSLWLVLQQALADERERIAREIESLDYEHHTPLGSVFKHPNEMKREAARVARGDV